MSVHQEHPAARSIERLLRLSPGEILLRRVLGKMECGQIIIDTPNGDRLVFEGTRPGPQARLTIHRWRCLWRLLTGWDLGFAEGYIAGEWSSTNIAALLNLAGRNAAFEDPLLRLPRLGRRLWHSLNRNTRRRSRRNISAHYDLGNEFYEGWLDSGMSYSAALFSPSDLTLEQAQNAKLDRVLDLLKVSAGQRVLELGCGWGSLAERMLQRCNCTLTALTLSAKQLAFAQRRLDNTGVGDRCDIRLQDYRDVCGTFDRIVSIEMLEAVGEAYWPVYFETLRDRLRPGGIAIVQVITLDGARFPTYRRRPDFIQKFIFPGGMLPTAQIVEEEAGRAGLAIVNKEFFGQDYARTLSEWQRRFQNSWTHSEGVGFDERFKRTWEYYLAYCQAGFEIGYLQVGLYKLTKEAA